MESIIIGPDRIKLMLSAEDIKSYGVFGGSDIDSSLNGATLRRILRDAGFDTALSRLHVQVYDLLEGGCEMYVALLPEEIDDAEGNDASAVVFDTKEALCSLISRLFAVGAEAVLSVYRDKGLHFALFDGALPDFVGDYGRITGGDKIPYVLEYATPVCIKVRAEGVSDYL